MSKEYIGQDPLKVLKEVWGYDEFRENQLEAVQNIIEGNKDILFLARTGLGKALHKDTIIPLHPSGYTTMEHLREGHTIFGRDGNPTKVLKKFQPKVDTHYKLTFQNGQEVKCCKDHLWTLKNGETRDTSTIYNVYKSTDNSPISLVKKSPIYYPPIDVTSDLYNKGLWYASGVVRQLPKSHIYNDHYTIKRTLDGILSSCGARAKNKYAIFHYDRKVVDTVGTILSILGIVYTRLNLNVHDYVIVFESEESLCSSFKHSYENLHYKLQEYDEELPIIYETDTITHIVEIIDDPDDYYCITVDNKDKLFMITDSFIPTHNSLVFQLPSLIKPGMALVLSPLLALMEDQTIAANAKGLSAATYNSTLTIKQKREVTKQIKDEELNVLYIAPESLASIDMIDFLKEHGNISYVVWDESHCFPGNTKIATNMGPIPLAQLSLIKDRENLLILSKNLDTETIEYKPLLNVFKNPFKPLKELILEKEGSLLVTGDHIVFTDTGEKRVDSLTLKDKLITPKGSYISIELIRDISHTYDNLYDIEVEDNHNYFVYASDSCPVLVHNCISQYGNSFRPEYRKIGSILRAHFPDVPNIALTATADEQTREDIVKTLGFGKEESKFEFVTYTQDLDRPNIYYHVYQRLGNGYKQLLNIVKSKARSEKIVVYCTTKKECDATAKFLYLQGYKARPYYSTIKKKDKKQYLEEFLNNEIQIMCCTSAFGLGVDTEITTVISLAMPMTIEDLAQYFGRAGRSGNAAEAYLLYDKGKDIRLLKWLTDQSVYNPARKKVVLDKIDQMNDFTQSKECYRKQILNYFGQEYHKDDCGTCSNCVSKVAL